MTSGGQRSDCGASSRPSREPRQAPGRSPGEPGRSQAPHARAKLPVAPCRRRRGRWAGRWRLADRRCAQAAQGAGVRGRAVEPQCPGSKARSAGSLSPYAGKETPARVASGGPQWAFELLERLPDVGNVDSQTLRSGSLPRLPSLGLGHEARPHQLVDGLAHPIERSPLSRSTAVATSSSSLTVVLMPGNIKGRGADASIPMPGVL